MPPPGTSGFSRPGAAAGSLSGGTTTGDPLRPHPLLALAVIAVAACSGGVDADAGSGPGTPTATAPGSPTGDRSPTPAPRGTGPAAPASPSPPADAATTVPTGTATPAPDWLGTRVLEPGPDGRIPPHPTPPELRDRRIVTTDLLPAPPAAAFASAIEPVPDDVLARSTWEPSCPVDRSDLRYATVTFHGFDDRPHTGELLLHADAVRDVVAVFEQLYVARFPIEEMRVVAPEDLAAEPTGDGNNTTGFVCRPIRGASSWSEHAFGRAVDVNPFHNPYVRDGIVLPELATAYVDRDRDLPGMIVDGDAVVVAFRSIGWSWGGHWRSHTDPMHFSATGR